MQTAKTTTRSPILSDRARILLKGIKAHRDASNACLDLFNAAADSADKVKFLRLRLDLMAATENNIEAAIDLELLPIDQPFSRIREVIQDLAEYHKTRQVILEEVFKKDYGPAFDDLEAAD